MAAVWPNITVEDNAIQAHVASLRKILGQDAELLCTVHGQGYRLESSPVDQKTPGLASLTAVVPAGPWTGLRSAMAIGLVLSIAVASVWFFRSGAQTTSNVKATSQVAILPFEQTGSNTEVAGFARNLRDKISAALSDAQVLAVSEPDYGKGGVPLRAGQKTGSEFLLSGHVTEDGNALNIHLQLSDAAEGAAIWSGNFQQTIDKRTALLSSAATAVADAAHFAIIGRTGKTRLNAAGVAALVEARESMTAVSRPNPLLQMADYKKIIAMAPDFSWAHSGLAVADAFQLKSDPQNQALRDEARREANRALELESANGEAYLALELVLPRFGWRAREAVLLKGVKAAPGFSPVAYMEGRLLSQVGRNEDALFWLRRGHNIDPLHANNTFPYAVSLLSQGAPAESKKLLDEMDAQWPDHIATRNAHFWTSILSGKHDKTLAILKDASKWPVGMNQRAAEAWTLTIAARGKDRTRAQVAVKEAAAEGALSRGHALLLLSMLGDVDGAFAQAEDYLPADPQWGPWLFLEPTRPMRQDPRFMKLALKLGFAAYWRSTDQWPDFCSAPNLPYDCRAEVEKLAALHPTLKPMEEVQKAPIPY